jgi:hypothetical protein
VVVVLLLLVLVLVVLVRVVLVLVLPDSMDSPDETAMMKLEHTTACNLSHCSCLLKAAHPRGGPNNVTAADRPNTARTCSV